MNKWEELFVNFLKAAVVLFMVPTMIIGVTIVWYALYSMIESLYYVW